MRKYFIAFLLLGVLWIARGQTDFEIRYWFDSDDKSAQTETGSQSVWKADLDVSSISEGLHQLNVQVKVDDDWSAAKSQIFVKLPGEAQAECTYWFDNDYETRQTVNHAGGALAIDVMHLRDGFHLLHLQAAGNTTSPVTRMFLKVPPTDGIESMTCVLMLNQQIYRQEAVPAHGGIINWTLDVTDLPFGLHKVQALVVTPSGATSSVEETFIYRTMTAAEFASMKCLYSVDGGDFYAEAGLIEDNTFHFNLDMATLSDGLHKINYMLMGDNGVSSRVMTNFFFKTPLGGNGIVRYAYWLNEDIDNLHQVELEKREPKLSLMTLLPVDEHPIRSECYHFAVEKGKPMVYAKNDLHVRFFDAASRISESTERFIDYKVGHEVTDIQPINEVVGMARVDCPAENGFRWFAVDAAIGDSISIKTDKAASLQIFDPAGKEIYSVSGSESVVFGGCHAYLDGRYYVSLHDVKGSGSTIDLGYQHIDKYAVLSHTPNEVGAAHGYLHVDLFGNGYDKLQSAKLVCGGEVLAAQDIDVQDVANATLQFYITTSQIERGKYDLVLTFNDNGEEESLTVSDAVNIVEPQYGDIEISVDYASRIASPYPVKISVKNTGNVEYQMIPLYIGIDNPDMVNKITGMNFNISVSDNFAKFGLDTFVETDNLLNKGVKGLVLPTILPKLAANDTVTLQLGFDANMNARFNIYVWNYQPWSVNADYSAQVGMLRVNEVRPNPMCQIDPCELLSSVRADLAECICGITWGDLSLVTGIYAAMYNKWARDMNNAYGDDLDYYGISRYPTIRLCSPQDIINNVLEHCNVPSAEDVAMLRRRLDGYAEDGCPDPEPHLIDIPRAYDPNDIHGYQSAAGSKFVGNGVTDVYYSIEFENDPEIANAAAHHIVITDQLDGNLFDLSTFAPTSIKFGSKDILLDGEQNFVKTVDLRPEINVIAQLSLAYDAANGLATWDFLSLDPMTMEPTDHYMMGILPVNNDRGDGQGELTFDIKLKQGLDHGTKIPNYASIVFDKEDPIITPVWTNIIDNVEPTGEIVDVEPLSGAKMNIYFDGSDNDSGIWKYELYVQQGIGGAWMKHSDEPTESPYVFEGKPGVDYGFCIKAVDCAGNVEDKELTREASSSTFNIGDVNEDGKVDMLDALAILNKYIGNDVKINLNAADVNGDEKINALDALGVSQIYVSSQGMKAPQHYKRLRSIKL